MLLCVTPLLQDGGTRYRGQPVYHHPEWLSAGVGLDYGDTSPIWGRLPAECASKVHVRAAYDDRWWHRYDKSQRLWRL